MAKIKDLREKTQTELKMFLVDKHEALRQFRFNSGRGKTKNTKEGREIKKDIARILTLLSDQGQK